MQKILDVVETVGNKVPHPAVIFLILIVLVVVLSHVLHLPGTSVTHQVIEPGASSRSETPSITTTTRTRTARLSRLTISRRDHCRQESADDDGIRFMYSSLIPSFMSFTAVGLIIVAMIGVGVAEEAGLVNALIRKLVTVSPRWALTYILVFVGILSSIAADAGYLVLIPLAGTAFLSVGRHPLAGLATGFCRGRRRLHRQHVDQTARRHSHRVHERRHPSGRSQRLHRSDGQSVVFHRVRPVSDVLVRSSPSESIEPRLGEYQGQSNAAPRERRRTSPPTNRAD